MLLILLWFVVQDYLVQIQADNVNCKTSDFLGKMCSKKVYEPEDIISKESYKPIEINFVSMTTDMYLRIPIKYDTSFVKYKAFTIKDSCVKNIEDDFFKNLDKNQNVLTTIKFNQVRCLQSLQTRSFNGIGKSVVKLNFAFMPDLIIIEEDFFNIFTSLKMLWITNTNVSFIPDAIFKVLTNINSVKLNNNKLRKFPVIPLENKAILENIQAYGNPFHCICSLMDFINMMTKEMKSHDYKCFSPISFSGKPLTEIGDLCSVDRTTTTTMIAKNIKSGESVSVGYVKLEIIIGLSVLLLVTVIIIFIIIICKKRKRKPTETPVYNNGSPSKIVIFQNEECTEPLYLKNQML